MSEFKQFSKAVHAQYGAMSENELYVVDVADIFDYYLNAFPEGTNEIFRERREFDCNCCKQFVRHIGNLVIIEDGIVRTVWDNWVYLPEPFKTVSIKMQELIRQAPIVSVFRTKERQYGQEYNYDNHTNKRWDHFVGRIEDKHFSAKPDEARGITDAIYQVMKRGLEELTINALNEVVDLINSNSLYRGQEHSSTISNFYTLKTAYDEATNKNLFIWANLNNPAARFRNTVIGTLVTDLSDGKDLDEAVRMFESKVAPQNYKRPTAVITPRMIEQAVQTLKALNLEGAVNRRFATLEDVSVNNVLFVDNSVHSVMKDGLTDLLMTAVKPQTVDIKNAQDISIDDFLKNVIPETVSMEILFKNQQEGNLVSLTGGDGPERLFKWNNNFAWSYNGGVTDSIKERVKAAGGNINAKLRISLAWFNHDDLDIHCQSPMGHIYYHSKMNILDVDMNAGGGKTRTPVENLAFNRMEDGLYSIAVNQFSKREDQDTGFTIEIEYAGKITVLNYEKALPQSATVPVIDFQVKNGQVIFNTPHPHIKLSDASKDVWNVKTETLLPVDIIMASPNHWDDQQIGNKHWFFMIKGCKNPEPTRGIYNEFLRSDLDKHRKVFEVLGSKTKCPVTDNQISGLGFSSTKNDEVIVVCKGIKTTKTFNIKF